MGEGVKRVSDMNVTNIPTYDELLAEHPQLAHLTRDELAIYCYIIGRSKAIDEGMEVIGLLTGVKVEAVQ